MSLQAIDLAHVFRSPSGDERPVLAIGDWSVAAGEQILLRGVSGSGKTTLLNILAGLLAPSQGDVLLDGVALYAQPEHARDRLRAASIGYIFQNHYLVDALTARENVQMPMAFARRLNRNEQRRRADLLLERVGLAGFERDLPRRLSIGQRLRVAIARALANAPHIMLADEPTAALDPASAAAVMDLLQEHAQRENGILIVASHDPALEPRFDTVIDLRAGVLHQSEIVQQPAFA